MAPGEALQGLELRGRLDVEEQDALSEARHELVLGLADPREDHLLGIEAGPHRPVQLAARDDVRAGPEGGQRPHDRQVAVRLRRVADQVVKAGESLVKLPVRSFQGGVAVDVGRGSGAGGDLVEGDAFAPEAALPVGERVVQGVPPSLA